MGWKFCKVLLTIWVALAVQVAVIFANNPPYFLADLNNHVIPENTPIGSQVYTLKAVDPEGSPLKFGLMGTEKLAVNEKTGEVTVIKAIDRESASQFKLKVTVEDVVEGTNENNLVIVPVVVTVLDLNDNPPHFINQSAFELVQVSEDLRIGSKILSVSVTDSDITGLALSLNCTPAVQSPEACEVFSFDIKEATSGHLRAEMKLGKKLEFSRRSFYSFLLTSSDGDHSTRVPVNIKVQDVQNSPPIFTGSMSGRISEDAPVGSLVMIIQAKDGDQGNPRAIKLSLLSNPGNCFQLDSKSGQLSTTRPLDRETLGSVLKLQVKALEVIGSDEIQGEVGEDGSDGLETVGNITILIDDVNDYAPRFSRKEMWTDIDENSPVGTPLSDLDFEIVDLDSGVFADFDIRIDGPLGQFFDIEPKVASGSARPVIRINKVFDFENPNERKFILLVVAQNAVDPQLVSTATITVVVNDLNDNAPVFDKNVYTLKVPESISSGSQVGSIVANDPDSKEFGNAGIVYQLVGAGNKKFSVNPKTGDIFVSECNSNNNNNNASQTGAATNSITTSSCLDFETQKSYDLLYMASDNYKQDGFIHSIVPLQILLTDSNDYKPSFTGEFSRLLLENAAQFEPKFFVRAKDTDATAVLSYRLLEPLPQHFKIDPNSAEILIKSPSLPPGDYSFRVEATDGLYKTATLVTVNVTDLNNNRPTFAPSSAGVLNIREDAPVGELLTTVAASDPDLGENGRITYAIQRGSYGYFEMDPTSGALKLLKSLENKQKFELVLSAVDHGTPPLRATTTVKIGVEKVYKILPKFAPRVQRAQVSESAKVGDVVLKIKTEPEGSPQEDLSFQFVQPVEARNVDNKPVRDLHLFPDWFDINNAGEVRVKNEIERDIVISLNYTVMITSKSSVPNAREFGTILLTLFEVNDLPPRVEDMEIETDEELPPGMPILTLEAEDPEGGTISHFFVQQGSEFISIDNKTGEIKVAGRLDFEEKPVYNFTVVVVDSGVPQLSSTANIAIHLLNINDNTPEFSQSEYEASILEHSAEGTLVTTVAASDLDGDVVSYEIQQSGPISRAFRVDRVGRIFVTKEGSELIDRENLDASDGFIRIGIGARDTNRIGYATVRIFVKDVNDVVPTMEQKSYHMTVYAPLTAAQRLLRVSADGGDSAGTDHLSFSIVSGNEDGILAIDSASGVISASKAFDKERDLRLVVEVNDSLTNLTGHYDRSGVLIQVLPGNFRRPEFVFPNKVNWTLNTEESGLDEIRDFKESEVHSKLIGQVLAFDSDEGEAGRISYYFKEGDNLVTETEKFKMETESGKVYQIQPLDREQINAYNLLVVAKDGGKPVVGMSQHVLSIQVQDIDDHGPKFLTKNYNFSIKENSLENSFVGQVEAVDEDEGSNAQVFYFVASEEADKYANEDIRVDIKTGRLFATNLLDRERMETYKLYVRASSSPIFNKTAQMVTKESAAHDDAVAIVTVTVLDENDNPVRFIKKTYFAAICSEAEPGREILTLQTQDLDASSSIQYSLLGSNLILDEFKSGGSVVPSPFRVDETTGRLTISSVTMRQYSGGNNRFVVKVGAREVLAPFYEDTTTVNIWVVENSQMVILTVKSPPEEMLRTQLIDDLSNITDSLVLISKIAPHVSEDGSVNALWSDVFVSAVDKRSSAVLPVGQFLQALDLGHDRLRLSDCPVELYSAVPALGTADPESEYFFNTRDSFDTAFAGLVALVALLCMGLAAILALCCCLNRYYSRSSRSSESEKFAGMKYPLHNGDSSPGTPALGRHSLAQPPDMLEDLATDNPLWIDHKLKTYEEQELTMQVASELDTNGTDDGRSMNEAIMMGNNNVNNQHPVRQHSPQFSHAYATLHPQPQNRRSYDQLNILGQDTLAVHL